MISRITRLIRCVRDGEAYVGVNRSLPEEGGSSDGVRLRDRYVELSELQAPVEHRRQPADSASVDRSFDLYGLPLLPDHQAKQIEGFLESVVLDISICRVQLLYVSLIAFGCSVIVIMLLRWVICVSSLRMANLGEADDF